MNNYPNFILDTFYRRKSLMNTLRTRLSGSNRRKHYIKKLVTSGRSQYETFDTGNVTLELLTKKQSWYYRKHNFYTRYYKLRPSLVQYLLQNSLYKNFTHSNFLSLNKILFSKKPFTFLVEWFHKQHRRYGDFLFIHTGRDFSVVFRRFIKGVTFSTRYYRYLSSLTPIPGRTRKKVKAKKSMRITIPRSRIELNKPFIRFTWLDPTTIKFLPDYEVHKLTQADYSQVKWQQRRAYTNWKRFLVNKQKYIWHQKKNTK